MRPLLLLVALSLLPARARAEGSTIFAEKVGACALLTAADAARVWNVPMQVQVDAPGGASPGRSCTYHPVRPGVGRGTVHLLLLDAHEWSRLTTDAGARGREVRPIKGIGDEAYVVRQKRAGALVLIVRRQRSQFSVRYAGAGLDLTDPMRQVARSVAMRLPAGP